MANKWQVSEAEFRGFVKAKLESQGNQLNDIKKFVDGFDAICSSRRKPLIDDISDLKEDVATAKGFARGAMIAGSVGFGSGILSFLTRWLK